MKKQELAFPGQTAIKWVDFSIETPAKKPRSERATEKDQAQKEKVAKAREAKENTTSEAKGR